MLKILTSSQLREADAYTISNEPVKSIDLMERAAMKATSWILENTESKEGLTFFCGPGNNGGDGLAIARLLISAGRSVDIYITDEGDKCSEDFLINLERLRKISSYTLLKHNELPPCREIVVDALFGSGMNRNAEGIYKDIIAHINASPARTISIDIPSGLLADSPTDGIVVKAHATLTFQAPKLSFLFPETGMYTGTINVLDIGLNKDHIASLPSLNYVTEEGDIRLTLKRRHPFSHKGTYGHALLIAGSSEMTGAALLAASASLKAGAGKTTVCIPESCRLAVNCSLPEAMTTVAGETYISTLPDLSKYTSVGVGPGLGRQDDTAKMLKRLIQEFRSAIVIDADALNILAENKTWLAFLPPGCILTPHPSEFNRLAGNWNNSFDRHMMQVDFSKKYQCYVVLKDHYTCISCPDGSSYFNTTGNAGMATAGSGDVLTGIITSFLAQGYSPLQSAIMGVYIHGFAGDLAAAANSQESLIASDITAFLGKAFLYLHDLRSTDN